MRRKRSQITIQFNWIFLLIVGGIILFFFIGLVNVQKKGSTGEISAELLSQLSTYFTGAGVSIGTVTVYDVPRMHLAFTCDGYTVNDVATRPFSNKVVFAPDEIDDNKLITWTLDWSVPFRVMNLLYVTSPQIRYIVLYVQSGLNPPDILTRFNKTFPPELNVDYHKVTGGADLNSVSPSIVDYRNEKVEIINLNPDYITNDLALDLANSLSNDEADITLLNVDSSTVKYYEIGEDGVWVEKSYLDLSDPGNLQSKSSVNYFDDVSLFGAVFAADPEKYDCVVGKMFDSLHRMAYVLDLRSQNISESYKGECRAVHEDAIGALDTMKNMKVDGAQSSLQPQIGQLQTSSLQARRYSCAPIY